MVTAQSHLSRQEPSLRWRPIADAFRRASFRHPIRSSNLLPQSRRIAGKHHRPSPTTRSVGRARLVGGRSATPPVARRASLRWRPIADAFRRASFRDPIRSSSPLRPCEQIADHRHRSSPMTRSMGRARLVDGHSAKPPVAPRAQPSMETNRRRLPPRELPPPDPFLKPAPAVTTNRRQAPPAKSHDAIGGSSQTGRRSQRNATCRAKGQPSMETNRRRLPPRRLPPHGPFLQSAPAMRTNR
jgi:hypothetical protein